MSIEKKTKKNHSIFSFSGDLQYVPIWEHMPISGMVHPGFKNFCPDFLIFILPTYVKGTKFT